MWIRRRSGELCSPAVSAAPGGKSGAGAGAATASPWMNGSTGSDWCARPLNPLRPLWFNCFSPQRAQRIAEDRRGEARRRDRTIEPQRAQRSTEESGRGASRCAEFALLLREFPRDIDGGEGRFTKKSRTPPRARCPLRSSAILCALCGSLVLAGAAFLCVLCGSTASHCCGR